MKTLLKKITLFACIVLAASCGEDNLDPVGNWTITEATPMLPADNSALVLNEDSPSTVTRFEWNQAETSNQFVIQYKVVLVPAESEDYSNPLLSLIPGNSGKNLFLETTAEEIDYALWAACYPAGAEVDLKWAVIAWAIDKQTVATHTISVTRFETEYDPQTLYITGPGTESGTDVTDAMKMRAQTDGDGENTGIFDVYTGLKKDGTFEFHDRAAEHSKMWGGGASKALDDCGTAIPAPSTNPYRVTVNLNTDTYDTLKITKWSLVGDAVEGGWGGDVPLAYKGNGVWQGRINFVADANFIFRANGDWGYIIKRIQGTATANNKGGDVIMESEAGGAGLTYEDVPSAGTGMSTVTLNLSADSYTYSIVYDPVAPAAAIFGAAADPSANKVAGNFTFGTYTAPAELYLVSDGETVATFTKAGNVFSSGKYLALQQSKTYILNSESDGSGTTYNTIGDGSIAVARDQAYSVSVDFGTGKVSWAFYNLKLFHWDEVGGGWDARQELLMTYVHPYKYEYTGASLTSGYHSKFISPWDIQYGTAATALTGTMTNGGPNYTGINSTGTYNATIVVNDMHTEGTYTFVKQ
jgi:starch-binding outer membrane protein SusE/F